MDDDEAWRWVAAGTALATGGLALLGAEDPFLLTLWGTALVLAGGVAALVGTGVLLRFWR